MAKEPLVSIIINNYNYGRFLKQAIESALDQTYQKTEVIVVDDGSTDTSRQVITNYNGQIIAVLNDNGGQASALNGCFFDGHWGVLIFRDADDMVLPHTAQRMAEVLQSELSIARVQYRLAVIDG